MHHASVNEKSNGGKTTPSGHHFIMTSMQAIKVPYDMHKKGFIDMVKGLLAWLSKIFWVFKVFWSNSFVSNAIYRRKNNSEKNKAIIKQKNQSAQKNVNAFLLNTRVKTKKGKIPSFGFTVAE